MFGDHDLWPVTCSECGFFHDAEIGVLKATECVRCPRCGSDLAYCSEGFQNQLRSAKEAFEHVAREAFKPGWNHLAQSAVPPDADYARAAVARAQQTVRQYALTCVLTSKRRGGPKVLFT